MNKEDIREELINNSFYIYEDKTISQHVYNEGLNERSLDLSKSKILSDSISNYKDLVKIIKEYPKGDIQDIHLNIDFLIIPRKEFDKIFE